MRDLDVMSGDAGWSSKDSVDEQIVALALITHECARVRCAALMNPPDREATVRAVGKLHGLAVRVRHVALERAASAAIKQMKAAARLSGETAEQISKALDAAAKGASPAR